MAARYLFFFCSAGIHAQNAVSGTKTEKSGCQGQNANQGPERPAHQPPDNQSGANCNANVSIRVAYVCCHMVPHVFGKFSARPWWSSMRQGWPSIVKLLAVLIALSSAAAPAKANDGDDFLAAREAWAKGDMRRFEQNAAKIPSGFVLRPYIEYWKTARRLSDDSAVADFLSTYPGTWLSERLRNEWLKELGRRENWAAYLAEFPRLARPEMVHVCLARRAELASGNRTALGAAVSLWFSGSDMPTPCAPLFASLFTQGLLTEEDVWKRLRLAFEAGNPGVAKSLLNFLPQEKRPAPAWIDRAYQEPAKYLADSSLDWSSRGQREVAFLALSRLARTDSVAAARAFEPRQAQLSEPDRQYAWGLLAFEAARLHEPQALPWFQKTGGNELSEFRREWWVRAALRAGDWRTVLWAIGGMSEANRRLPAWQYWQARALKALGQAPAANRLFAPLSLEPHYYGLLAAEELGAVMGEQAINIKVSGEEVGVISRDAGIARAMALYELGLRTEASNEWAWAVRNFNDRQLLAAAELARSRDWHDRAINTAEKTRDQHDFDLRFLSPYREVASREARENKLDEAWVYGLMRQESRFMSVARSGVGAAGLMQIMPATGRWIAQRLGIKGFDTHNLNEPETNIKFGTYYLRHVQESLDGHPVLATAAYNAGPRRADRWRDSKPMEGAIYVESIPFGETRDYVKKVMSNAMYYALRFGQPSVLLVDRLGMIPARARPAPPVNANDTQPSLEPGVGES